MTHARGTADPGGRPRRSHTPRRSGRPPAWTGGVVGRTVAAVVLAVQVVALLLVGTYARHGPRLWGFPFFYWYTLLWLLLGAAGMAGCTWLLGRTSGRETAGGRGDR
ncbi:MULTISPECIES: DUF3311 domain-containing protein [Frankia]|uniref:Conserved hypothetical membrane protein n=1 Tax=Frankia alni (strain DSM 45986 / CECT 9034 / ACN14a) TaxID=326424 RepID=Q0RGD2_FRAAA|nr:MULTISPECIES: DUF3311 domain-containing protein [Frankia]CAJ63456.1 conserved hypothetical membrane protein [Frankia alni ACN14a]